MSAKYFITNLCELGPDMKESCQIYRSNPNSGTFSSSHSTIRQTSCPCPKKHSVHINRITRNTEKENKKPNRTKVKHRSRSSTPKKNRPGNSQNDDVWSTVVQTTATFNSNHCQTVGDKTMCNRSEYPVLQTYSTGKIPNQNIRKNLRSCSCVSAASAPSAQHHRSVIHSCSVPTYPDGHNHILCASEVVTHLKNDIEKVKSQLDQMADKNSESAKFQNTAKQVYHLKAEIKKLKKELEQKKMLHQASVKQADKFRDVLNDYERKVTLLHQQAVKSSKVMKQTKEKFCSCLKDKEHTIRQLKQTNETLQKSSQEKESQYSNQIAMIKNLEKELQEKIMQNNLLSDTNQNFCECIKMLEAKLENSSKETSLFKKLEQTIADYKCTICEKLEHKLKKQREKYENRIKELEDHEKTLREDIAKLTKQVQEAESVHSVVDTLEKERKTLQSQLTEIEPYVSKCKTLEEDCQKQYQLILATEEKYNKDREQLRQLVDELTTVVKENKVTLLHLSEVNKQQEELLFSHSKILLQKEEEIKYAESQIEMLSKKSTKLEQEINEMKIASADQCKNNQCECIALMEELDNLKVELVKERENKLVKDKIIEDQSNTINQLQSQIKEKTSELNRAREESSYAESEMIKVNDCLIQKNMELEKELDEKKRLTHKLRKLEQQKSELSSNLTQLENLVEEYCNCQNYDEEQRRVLDEFQQKVAIQKHEWEMQKAYLAREKDKAVKAAKFATQKLIDTVADFQKEVNAQKKVQVMLTKILHDKEEELQNVKERISSINSLSNPEDVTLPLDELFRNQLNDPSEPTTTVSYSSWSNSSKHSRRNQSRSQTKQNLQEIFEAITRIEQPVKDS